MRRFSPVVGAVAALALVLAALPSEGQIDTKPRVAIGPCVSQNQELEYRAAAAALDDMLALKLRYSRECYTIGSDEFAADAAEQGVTAISSPNDLRDAMSKVKITYATYSTIAGTQGALDARVSLYSWDGQATRIEETIEVNGATVDLDGLGSTAAVGLAKLLRVPDADGAYDRIRRARISANQSATMAYYMGRALLAEKTPEAADAAAAKFVEALAADATLRPANLGLGEVYEAKAEIAVHAGDLDAALKQFAGASLQFAHIGESRAYARAQRAAAGVYSQQSDVDNQIKCLQNAAGALIENGSPDALTEANEILKFQIPQPRDNADTYYLLGKLRWLQANMPPGPADPEATPAADPPTPADIIREAAHWFEQAYSAGQPGRRSVKLLLDMGRFYRESTDLENQMERSIECCLEAAAQAPDNWETHMELGDTYTAAESYEQGIGAYRRSYDLIPEDRPALRSRALEGAGRCYYRDKNAKEAIPCLEAAMELEPANVNAAVLLVLSYAATGDVDKAKQRLEELIKQFPAELVPYDLKQLQKTLNEMGDRALEPLDDAQAHRRNPNPYAIGGRYEDLERRQRELDQERAREEREKERGGAGGRQE
jgi:tetratricopeptide (TPR) repeat protein